MSKQSEKFRSWKSAFCIQLQKQRSTRGPIFRSSNPKSSFSKCTWAIFQELQSQKKFWTDFRSSNPKSNFENRQQRGKNRAENEACQTLKISQYSPISDREKFERSNPKTNLGKPCNKFVKCPLTFLAPLQHTVCSRPLKIQNNVRIRILVFIFAEMLDFGKYLQSAFSISTYSPNSQTRFL